jgi:signal transduction histidine kinase
VLPADSSKSRVAGSIAQAKAALQQALVDLERMPTADPNVTAYLAHALNNFLSVSLATLDLLRETLALPQEHEAANLLDGLQHSTQLMAATVARLQGEAVEVRLRRVPVAMPLIAERGVVFYQPEAAAKSLTITSEAEPGLPHVWTDGIAVGAVIDNLLSNAVKYSPAGTAIVLRLRRDGDDVVFEVVDQGPGLSEGDQQHLFVAPGPLTPKPTAGERSHGHGLVVAATLVGRLGGTIGCRSELGQGSTFWFRLPIAGPQAAPLSRP